MKTIDVYRNIFISRTTGKSAMFTINRLSLDAVKIVLKGIQLPLCIYGGAEDAENGFLKLQRNSGFYGGSDGYIPTTKGYRTIYNALKDPTYRLYGRKEDCYDF